MSTPYKRPLTGSLGTSGMSCNETYLNVTSRVLPVVADSLRCTRVDCVSPASVSNVDCQSPIGQLLSGELRCQLGVRSNHIESGIQCQVSGRHFEEINVGKGHIDALHEWLLTGDELGNR